MSPTSVSIFAHKTKTCSICLVEKPNTHFYKHADGLYGTRGQCAECLSTRSNVYRKTPEGKLRTKKYNRLKVVKIRQWFLAIKESFKCSRCPESRAVCLDFHHTDPTKKERNVSGMINGAGAESKKRILKEIEKCVVLCANCHRVEHSENVNRKK
jgi:hypothetical protein